MTGTLIYQGPRGSVTRIARDGIVARWCVKTPGGDIEVGLLPGAEQHEYQVYLDVHGVQGHRHTTVPALNIPFVTLQQAVAVSERLCADIAAERVNPFNAAGLQRSFSVAISSVKQPRGLVPVA